MNRPASRSWTWSLVFRWPLGWPPMMFRAVEGDLPAEVEANEQALQAAVVKERTHQQRDAEISRRIDALRDIMRGIGRS